MDTNDPFTRFGMGGGGGGMGGGFPRSFSSGMGGLGGHGSVVKKQQDPPVVHDLQVTLEEVLAGGTKKMKISRKRLNPDGRTIRREDKILEVQIKKGWKEGTKITFPKEGDETPTNIPADVVFVLKDKPHPVFRRDGSDIIYPAKISLRDVSFPFVFLVIGRTGRHGGAVISTVDGRSYTKQIEHLFKCKTLWCPAIIILETDKAKHNTTFQKQNRREANKTVWQMGYKKKKKTT